ncbi:hypothetical protein K2173_020921 [Erythroxylum novogranatense]|uniref:SWIM-type domain-containing protein n=1 Tax=Erythroxylum novogranatense TaxID=1862640 RepID=A0AAV8TM40_9ROSI|nr:hypothetical protein K2173_020921 [Erythroxylum novogranatense]
MPREKLILICQYGGEFATNDDGSLLYDGGEAHALDINSETSFDDLKIKMAEMCNLEFKSLSLKYFLPGNKRTLITLSNEKHLKRMLDFHRESVTADIFVAGREVLNHDAYCLHSRSDDGIKPAETVTVNVASQMATATPVRTFSKPKPSTPRVVTDSNATSNLPVSSPDSLYDVNVMLQIPSGLAINLKQSPASAVNNDPGAFSAENHTAEPSNPHTMGFDMSDTPADTVKKRRRTASWKMGANGPIVVSIADDSRIEDVSKCIPLKMTTPSHDVSDIVETQLAILPWIDSTQSPNGVNTKKVSSEIALWKDGITGVGQEFKSVAEFREVLQKYAIAHHFVYKLKKNDTNRATGVCSMDGCPWKIHATWVPSEQVFRIKKMDKPHTCGGKSWKAAYPAKNWLVSIIKDRLRENPRHKPKDISNGIYRDFGIELNYTQVWRGMEEARGQLQGSYKEAYSQLPWFCDKVVEANPNSLAKLVINDENRFQRLFVSFQASVYGFLNGCRPLLFLDSTNFMSKYHEVLLMATALDGDDGLFPVSFAVVDVENDDNWHWFLEQLRSALPTLQPITFITDKEKGLLKLVLQVFENAYCGYSIYYLLDNFQRNLKGPFHADGRGALPGLFQAAASAARIDDFRMLTEQIKRISPKAQDWLAEVEPANWTNALFKGESYHHIITDVAEFYSQWIEEAQELPIIQKLETLWCRVMELINKRQIDSNIWPTKLIPSKERKLREETQKSCDLRVFLSSDSLFEVHEKDIVNVVDIEKSDCSCLRWKMIGLPCSHAIAVFNCKGWSAYDHCSEYFTVDRYLLTYSKSINPVLETLNPQGEKGSALKVRNVLPPNTPRPSQHDEKRRRLQRELKRVMSCSRCKGEGHNKATCKETLYNPL